MAEFELLKEFLSRDPCSKHSWLYGQDFVRCIICGAETVEESVKPCPGFVGEFA